MIELHWTRDQVLDQIDIPFLEDLCRAWEDCPPLRRMVAAYLGIKPKRRTNNLQELLAMFPQGVIR